jgi:hypothetical protein
MNIDLYTKTVLTAIAVGLIWVGINTTMPATAGPEIIAVDIVKIEGQKLQYARALPVSIVK